MSFSCSQVSSTMTLQAEESRLKRPWAPSISHEMTSHLIASPWALPVSSSEDRKWSSQHAAETVFCTKETSHEVEPWTDENWVSSIYFVWLKYHGESTNTDVSVCIHIVHAEYFYSEIWCSSLKYFSQKVQFSTWVFFLLLHYISDSDDVHGLNGLFKNSVWSSFSFVSPPNCLVSLFLLWDKIKLTEILHDCVLFKHSYNTLHTVLSTQT